MGQHLGKHKKKQDKEKKTEISTDHPHNSLQEEETREKERRAQRSFVENVVLEEFSRGNVAIQGACYAFSTPLDIYN